jgi:hypothetical protein
MRKLPHALAFALLGLAACSADAGPSAAGTSAETQAANKGTPLVDCWLEADTLNHGDLVTCAVRSDAAALPVKLTSVYVSDDHGFGSDVGVDPTQPKSAGTFDSSRAYTAHVQWDASGVAGLGGLSDVQLPLALDGNAHGRDKAKSGRLPFEIWRVALVGHAGMTQAALADTQLPLVDNNGQATPYSVQGATLPDVTAGATKVAFVAALPKTILAGNATFDGGSAAFALAGPGTYFVESSGIVHATADANAPAAWSCWVQGTDALALACRPEAAEGLSLMLAKITVTPSGGAGKMTLVEYKDSTKSFDVMDAQGATTPVADPKAIVVQSLAATDFPIQVDLQILLTGSPSGLISYGSGSILGLSSSSAPEVLATTPLTGSFAAASATDVTVDVPFTLPMPFRLWPVTVTAQTDYFFFSLDDYTVTAASDWGTTKKGDKITVSGAQFPALPRDQSTSVFVAVDSSITKLTGKARFGGDEVPFTLSGAGVYVAQPDGLHAAP